MWGRNAGAPGRGTRPPHSSPHSTRPLIPLSAARDREASLRAGRKGSTWPGREAKDGLQRGGPGQESGGHRLGSGRAPRPAPPPHPHSSPLLSSSEVALGPLTSFGEAPAAVSCPARLPVRASAPQPTWQPLPLRPDPRPRPSRARRVSRREAEAREPLPASLTTGNAWFGAELAPQTSGSGFLPQDRH